MQGDRGATLIAVECVLDVRRRVRAPVAARTRAVVEGDLPVVKVVVRVAAAGPAEFERQIRAVSIGAVAAPEQVSRFFRSGGALLSWNVDRAPPDAARS